jgi:membrane fusion protein (multidrug efflux system)
MSARQAPEVISNHAKSTAAGNESPAAIRRRGPRMMQGLALLATLVAVLATAGCAAEKANSAEKTDGEEKAPVPVEVVAARRGDISDYVSATANLVAENDVAVLAEIEGRVTELNVDEGATVLRGQILARLDSSDQEIAHKKAELKHANAKLVFDRGEDLMAKELISQEEHDRLTVDFQVSRQELAEAEWALSQTVLRAPFGGRVTARHIQLGQHIRPGDSLFQITDFEPLIARIYLSEADIIGLAPGTPARIQLNANPGLELAARIRQISPVVDTATGTVKVTVEAISPPADVRPGSFVSIHVVRETHSDALLVPRGAVVRELQSSHVFVADGETAVKRRVDVGLEEGGEVEILQGLSSGDRVVVAGQGGLREGERVRILETAAEPAEDAAADPKIAAGA